MFNVFLDTSVLPRHPSRLGAAFERLCELAQLDVTQVYLSEIVVQEWRSQLRDALAEDLKKADTTVQCILRHPWIEKLATYNQIKSAQISIDQTLQDIDLISQTEVETLLERLQVTVLPVGQTHGIFVAEAYFQGLPPFKKAKSREDFPDAFVYFCAADLCQETESQVYCLVADKTLKNALKDLKNMQLLDNIKEFVQADFVKEEARKREVERRWEEILDHIQPFLPQMEQHVRSIFLKNQLFAEGVASKHIEHPEIPDDNSQALIIGVYEPSDVKFKWDNIEDYGAGLITVPIEYECTIDVEFLVFRSDVFDVPDNVYVEWGDFESDHYFEASGSVTIKVSASLSIAFDLENRNENELPEIASIRVDDVAKIAVCDNNYYGIFH